MVIVLCVYFLLVFSRSLCPLYFVLFESFCHFLFYFDSHSHVSSVMLIVFLFLGCSPLCVFILWSFISLCTCAKLPSKSCCVRPVRDFKNFFFYKNHSKKNILKFHVASSHKRVCVEWLHWSNRRVFLTAGFIFKLECDCISGDVSSVFYFLHVSGISVKNWAVCGEGAVQGPGRRDHIVHSRKQYKQTMNCALPRWEVKSWQMLKI